MEISMQYGKENMLYLYHLHDSQLYNPSWISVKLGEYKQKQKQNIYITWIFLCSHHLLRILYVCIKNEVNETYINSHAHAQVKCLMCIAFKWIKTAILFERCIKMLLFCDSSLCVCFYFFRSYSNWKLN